MSVYCGASQISIPVGRAACIVPVKKNSAERGGNVPAALPIFGVCGEFGNLDDIVHDENTKLMESYFGIPIEQIVDFLIQKSKGKKVKTSNKELRSWNYMWMDMKTYELMSNWYDPDFGWGGYLGTHAALTAFGFELVDEETSTENQYTAFGHLGDKDFLEVFLKKIESDLANSRDQVLKKYKNKHGVEILSDGRYIKSATLKYRGENIVIDLEEETLNPYVDIPDELYGKPVHMVYHLFDRIDQIRMFKHMFDIDLETYERSQYVDNKGECFVWRYFDQMEIFGDRIATLKNIHHNMFPMSKLWEAYVPFVAPRDGEHEWHQRLLEGFAEINQSYIEPE